MWRFANKVYRAFRNTATHRCQQDILLPFPTACNTDDEENAKRQKDKNRQIPVQYNINDVLKQNQFSPPDLEKIQNCLTNFAVQQFVSNYTREKLSKSIEEKNSSIKTFLQRDENCQKAIEELSAIHEEGLAEIHLQMAVDALDADDFAEGVRLLQLSIANGRNAPAFYNLGLCYEEGLGVEKDRRKACEFYRQASLLGHVDAQLNLTRLSNQIDLHGSDSDDDEQSLGTVKDLSVTPPAHQRFDWIDQFDEDLSVSDYSLHWKNTTVACLSS